MKTSPVFDFTVQTQGLKFSSLKNYIASLIGDY